MGNNLNKITKLNDLQLAALAKEVDKEINKRQQKASNTQRKPIFVPLPRNTSAKLVKCHLCAKEIPISQTYMIKHNPKDQLVYQCANKNLCQ